VVRPAEHQGGNTPAPSQKGTCPGGASLICRIYLDFEWQPLSSSACSAVKPGQKASEPFHHARAPFRARSPTRATLQLSVRSCSSEDARSEYVAAAAVELGLDGDDESGDLYLDPDRTVGTTGEVQRQQLAVLVER
jgi:hypothetical protein